jgi:hypothetical protein
LIQNPKKLPKTQQQPEGEDNGRQRANKQRKRMKVREANHATNGVNWEPKTPRNGVVNIWDSSGILKIRKHCKKTVNK